ncbi:hypothetical protein D8B26_004956 [Coccidioides posadasii str. Silveira]|uniref:Uncharacterized protein n=3 Tax=Coccidioides posadasii TaxID=199306 RepID=E9D5A9_COCPS|nr:conserved hypothetical protein [Coccidioides posadasii str. Silveira]QVM10296.1 hypothetical protein D8B26_004956 [Coccidioides posadasii str. Silveira]
MDTGGLAQMTFNASVNGGSLGVPGSGFASRGKGSHIKRLSVPHPSRFGTGDESQALPTPRTSRSHLLAGLRTAPKQPSTPTTAPLLQQRPNHLGLDTSAYGASQASYVGGIPHSATGTTFSHTNGSNLGMSAQMYSLPEHVLAPPALDQILQSGEPIDESLYNELVQTNLFLAAQQQRLQQQLATVTAAAQQFQALNLGSPLNSQHVLTPGLPGMSFYQQQAQHGMQPVVNPVPGKPGMFSVYNPMTGQHSYLVDNNAQEEPQSATYQEHFQSPAPSAQGFRNDIPSPPEQRPSPVRTQSSNSPTRVPSPTRQASPLQQHISNKRLHRKIPSVSVKTGLDLGRNSTPKLANFPPTPATGTFGPGQGRAGEHPLRQPRGPPSLEELVAKPTAKHEGSKNFVTRQRRRAVHNLVRAGMERRSGNSSTAGSVTPSSDVEFNFSPYPGDEGSMNPSSHSSVENLRGAIGSERRERESSPRDSVGRLSPTGGKFGEGRMASPTAAEIVARHPPAATQLPERRKMPMFLLSSAEKRKTPLM